MKNVVVVFLNKDGDLYCKEISEKGMEYMNSTEEIENDNYYWDAGGTIVLSELMDILKKER